MEQGWVALEDVHPEGIKAISQGLSAAMPLESGLHHNQPGGLAALPESSNANLAGAIYNNPAAKPLRTLRVRCAPDDSNRGSSDAPPPANRWEPSGFEERGEPPA